MKAVILAAGKGTRMGELTSDVPKPMLKVHGKPILEHIIEGLVRAGVDGVCVITGWRAEVVESYFGDGAGWDTRVSYVRQEIQDGTGKARELAQRFLDGDDFILTYGDILVPPETYTAMVSRYREGDFSGLLTVTEGEDVTKGGLNFFDGAFCLTRLVEKPSQEQIRQLTQDGMLRPGDPVFYNAGIYIFRSALFDFTARLQKSPRDEYELTDAIQSMVEAGHRIAGHAIAGRWVDVRDPEVLAQLEAEAQQSDA